MPNLVQLSLDVSQLKKLNILPNFEILFWSQTYLRKLKIKFSKNNICFSTFGPRWKPVNTSDEEAEDESKHPNILKNKEDLDETAKSEEGVNLNNMTTVTWTTDEKQEDLKKEDLEKEEDKDEKIVKDEKETEKKEEEKPAPVEEKKEEEKPAAEEEPLKKEEE